MVLRDDRPLVRADAGCGHRTALVFPAD